MLPRNKKIQFRLVTMYTKIGIFTRTNLDTYSTVQFQCVQSGTGRITFRVINVDLLLSQNASLCKHHTEEDDTQTDNRPECYSFLEEKNISDEGDDGSNINDERQ